MHRAIVTSATYRQSSRVSPELLAKDPENRLLARGPRVRLEAEVIRDSVLQVERTACASGSAGRAFSRRSRRASRPREPTAAWPGTSSPGGDRYRRGLYTFTKRTAPFAMTLTFDGPSGEVCVARREMSNSPLQALTLLNDPVFVEACQALGQLMAKAQGTVEERIGRLFRLCLARSPQPDELSMLVQFLPESAAAARAQGARRRQDRRPGRRRGDRPRGLDVLVARAILNLDETVTKG